LEGGDEPATGSDGDGIHSKLEVIVGNAREPRKKTMAKRSNPAQIQIPEGIPLPTDPERVNILWLKIEQAGGNTHRPAS